MSNTEVMLGHPSKDIEMLRMAAEIISAYVTKNAIPQSELPSLIAATYASLDEIATGAQKKTVEAAPLNPAVSIKKSVTDEYIICLDDGKKFKSLRRHLNTVYNLTPDQYRAKWGLPSDYPVVAPSYAAVRSELAKKVGLGQARKGAEKKMPVKKKAA